MPLALLATLALVQGVTEFLPISSSAHLVLTRWVWAGLGLEAPPPDPAGELALDVALHVGTLLAVALYFRKDVAALLRGGVDILRVRATPDRRLALLVLIATIPAFLAGALGKSLITEHLRGVEVIGWTTLIFGLLLGWADRQPAVGRMNNLSWKGALFVGAAQAFALIPGVSRSGVAMTACRQLGLSRPEAARFALLLALPSIAGAGALASLDLVEAGAAGAAVSKDALIGAGLAFIAAYAAIMLMMRWLRDASFKPFVIYRVILGLVILGVAYLA